MQRVRSVRSGVTGLDEEDFGAFFHMVVDTQRIAGEMLKACFKGSDLKDEVMYGVSRGGASGN